MGSKRFYPVASSFSTAFHREGQAAVRAFYGAPQDLLEQIEQTLAAMLR